MVGGIVIGVMRDSERTHVHVAECPHYPKHKHSDCPRADSCWVYTDEKIIDTGERVCISLGDSFWWQSGSCYWTPKANRGKPNNRGGGVDYDIRLSKIGFSH